MKKQNKINISNLENHLFATRKEERHLAWAMLQKNNSFFSPLRSSGFFIEKNNKVFYKYKFVASIIGRYVYLVKKQLKIYSLFLLFLKKLIKRKYYKNNSIYFKIKKTQKAWIRKKKIILYKKHIFIWYKKWFLKKYRKQRRRLWKSYHNVSYTFWGNLLKKRTKSLIFKLLNKSHLKIKFSLKTYNELTKYIFFFIKKKKRKRINWKMKNKKYKINVGVPIYLQYFKYNLSKYKIKNVFPLQNKNYILSEQFNNNKSFFLNIISNQLTNLFTFYPNIYLFFINYNYFFYFLNLKNKKNFKLTKNNLEHIIYFYKTLGMFYKNKYYNSNLLIRTGILNKKKTFSLLQHGKYINFFLYWFSNFIKKYMIKGKYIVYNLFFLINNNYNLLYNINISITILKYKYDFKENLSFFFKKNILILKNKHYKEITFTSLKNSFLNRFSNLTKKKKKIYTNNNVKWYNYKIKNKYKFRKYKKRRFFFFPHLIKFKKKKKIKKRLNNIQKNNYLNSNKFIFKFYNKLNNNKLSNSYFIKKKHNKITNIKKKKKYFNILRKFKKIIFFYKLTNADFVNKKNFNKKYNYIKKKKHFLKRYRKKYYRLLRFIRFKLYRKKKKKLKRFKLRKKYNIKSNKKFMFYLLKNIDQNSVIKLNNKKIKNINNFNFLIFFYLYVNFFTFLVNNKIYLNNIIINNFKLFNAILLLNYFSNILNKNTKLLNYVFKFNQIKNIKKKLLLNKKNLLFFQKNNKFFYLSTQLGFFKKHRFLKKLKNSIFLLKFNKLIKKNKLLFLIHRKKYKYRYYNRQININNLLKEFLIHFIYRLLIFFRSVTRFNLINIKVGTQYIEGNFIKNLLFDDYLIKLLKNEYNIISNIKFNMYNLNGYYSKALINYYDWVSVEYSRFYFFNLLNYNNQMKNNLIYKNYIFSI